MGQRCDNCVFEIASDMYFIDTGRNSGEKLRGILFVIISGGGTLITMATAPRDSGPIITGFR